MVRATVHRWLPLPINRRRRRRQRYTLFEMHLYMGTEEIMDLLDGFEIYIPKKAEVKTIPLWSLSGGVLRRMGLPQSDRQGSRDLDDSPECTWISPAVLREIGRPPANQAAKERVTSQLGRMPQTSQPLQMPFVSSNPTAYKVLGEILHGKKVSTQTPRHGSSPGANQNAVVIYHGHIYLSMKKPKQVRDQGAPRRPKCVSPRPETSACASDRQKTRRSSRGVHKAADTLLQSQKRLLKRRCLDSQLQIILPKMSPEELKGRYAKADQESSSDCGSKKKHAMSKDEVVTLTGHEDEFMKKEVGESSSKAAHSVLPSSEGVHKVEVLSSETDGEDQPVEDGAELSGGGEEEEVVAATSSGESDMEDGVCQEAESDHQNDSSSPVDSGEVPEVERWTEGRLLTLSFSTPLHQDCDFDQLAEEEKISRMQAKLREKEAVLDKMKMHNLR